MFNIFKRKKKMEDWKERLIKERDELKEKLDVLNTALKENKIPKEAVVINQKQSIHMSRYLKCLDYKLEM